MARPLRSRKPPQKYSPEEYELGTKTRQLSVQTSMDAKTTELKPQPKTSENVENIKDTKNMEKAIKGNLNAHRRTLKGIRPAVLQDRTNLSRDPLKVDLLMKQGTGIGIAKRSAKAVRTTLESTTENHKGNENSKDSGVVTKRNLGKSKNHDKSPLEVNLTELAEAERLNKENTIRNVDSISNRATSSRIIKKSKKWVRKIEDSKLNDEKKATKKISRKSKKTSRKVTSEEESLSSVNRAVPLQSENKKSVKDTEGAAINTKKLIRSTRRAPKSKLGMNNDYNASATTDTMNNMPREISDETDTSVDSGLGTRDLAEQAKVQDSEIAGIATAKTLRNRAKTRRSLLEKNLDGSLAVPLSRRSVLVSGKKFFKSKATDAVVRIVSPVKRRAANGRRRNVGVRVNPRTSVSFRSRQMTLTESFAKQAGRKVLRPRATPRNYCEDTIVACGSKSGAVEETKRNVPIYKALELQETSIKDKNEIYEFRFDSNDSGERRPLKRRRKVVATKRAKDRAGSKKKLTGVSHPRADPTSDDAKTTSSQRDNIETVPEVEVLSSPVVVDHALSEPMNQTSPGFLPSDDKETGQITVRQPMKPIIVKSVVLRDNDRVSLTTTPILAKTSDAKPRQALQPSKQYRTMLNHALLNKSLSPIRKAIESFDPGSPWRPPTFVSQQFSRVKNMVQSTPQVRNFAARFDTTDVRKSSEPMTNDKNRVIKSSQITEKLPLCKAAGISGATRKFGTVISSSNNASNTVTKVHANKGDNEPNKGFMRENVNTKTVEQRISFTSNHATTGVPTEMSNFSNDDHPDKENSFPSCPSPKQSPLKSLSNSAFNKSPLRDLNRSPLKSLNKSPLKDVKKSPLKSLNKSPLKDFNKLSLNAMNESSFHNHNKSPLKYVDGSSPVQLVSRVPTKVTSNTENLKPQAGPSGAERSLFLNKSRVLRQSNLDNFLNLDEMPTSTSINTAHGIFDDAHSTPICGRSVRKIGKSVDLENAFGFDDNDDSNEAISLIEKPFTDHQVAKRTLAGRQGNAGKETNVPAKPARLSIGDIKKHLLPTRKKERPKEQQIIEFIEEEEKENREAVAVANKSKDHQLAEFVDTFDMVREKASTDKNGIKELPLFTDLEPQHFKQAPRYSYKRKRFVDFVVSEDDGAASDEENDDLPIAGNRAAKKRKISKLERERQKEMEHWAKGLNQTFEEIDHFDLVVE